MKKILLAAIATVSLMSAQAQKAYQPVCFFDNWSIGLDGGVTTPLSKGHAFFGDMRGAFGLHIQKQVTPVVAVGVEGLAGVNTSSWNASLFQDLYADYVLPGKSSTAIDNSYVGAYASFNLMNLFGGYTGKSRLFEIELVGGAGWGHEFFNKMALHPMSIDALDQNYFVTKAGLNLNFNVAENWTISLKPSVTFNMTGTEYNFLNVDQ